MTLALMANTGGVTYYAGDRLISVSRGATLADWDAQSNKALVLETPDARVVITYCGQAYVGSQPTDEWLADVVAGQPLEARESVFQIKRLDIVDIGRSVQRIQTALNEARNCGLLRSQRAGFTAVTVTGWMWHRDGRLRSIWWQPSDAMSGSFLLQRWPERWWRWGGTPHDFRLWACPRISEDQCGQVVSRVSAAPTESAILDSLVAGIRDVAATRAGVSRDCLTVKLVAATGVVEIRYRSAAHGDVDTSSVAYSPWVLARPGVLPPTSMTLGMGAVLGGLHVDLAELDEGPGEVRPLARKPPPS
jgi:hypothetical protein